MNTIQRFNACLFILFFSLCVAQAQPANNDYTNATALTVQAVQCYDSTNGTLVDATSSGIATGCFEDKTGLDVWYTAVVPASGELSVETTLPVGSDAYMVLTTFTLENSTLSLVNCEHTYSGYFTQNKLTNQTAGTTMYFQVAERVNVQNNGVGGHQVPFSICAWDSANTPTNDVYTSATLLPVDDAICNTPTQGTLTNANTTEIVSSGCSSSAYATTDVWYKLAIPASGDVSIQTSAAESGSLATGLALSTYRKENGILTIVQKCVEGKGVDQPLFQSTYLTDQTPGDSLYIQITNYELAYNGDDYDSASRGTAAFQICAWNNASLEIQQPNPALLSYYSNPVGNRLRLESPYKIQSLTIHDLAGREVLTKSPQKQKQKLWLNTYSLSSGVYLLNVQTAEGEQTVQLVKK